MVNRFSNFYHDPDSKYEPPDLYRDKSAKIHDKTPWHKFRRLCKESDDLIRVNPPRKGFIWGWDEATIRRLLGRKSDYYIKHFASMKFSFLTLLLGPGMFVYRGMLGPAFIGYVYAFIWGLLNMNIFEPVMFYNVFIMHVVYACLYMDAYKVKFITLMRKNVRQYTAIPEDLSNWLNKRIGCNTIGLVASSIGYVLMLIVLWKSSRGGWV